MNRHLLALSRKSIGTAIIAIVLFIVPAQALAAATFIDLTAKEYKGADSNLSGLQFNKFGIGCEENGTYRVGDAPAVSWVDRSGQEGRVLKSYTVHFRVKDRRGSVIRQEDFVFRRMGSQGSWPFPGRVFWGDPEDSCVDRSAVVFGKKIDLSFVTIEYWVSKIEWMKLEVSGQDAQSDKVAFSVPRPISRKPRVDTNSESAGASTLSSDEVEKTKKLENECEGKNVGSCFFLGLFYDKKGDIKKAMPFYESACSKNIGDGCTNFGLIKDHANDIESARKWYAKGCELNSDEGCINIGLAEQKAGNEQAALKWFKKACDKLRTGGCVPLGLSEQEHGKTKSAIALWTKACDAKYGLGCAYLGAYFHDQNQVEKSKDLYRKGCDYGEKQACQLLNED